MKPSDGRRTWVKLWVNDWLEGTTRYQMSDAQRAFWIDLLAMAGRSRFGGVVCSGKDGDEWIGYPLAKFQGLLSEPIDVLATFELFRRTGKITLQVTNNSDPFSDANDANSRANDIVFTPKLYTIFICSWDRYQSEYERVKKYRKPKYGNATGKVTPKVTSRVTKMSLVEVEGEVEGEGEKEVGGEFEVGVNHQPPDPNPSNSEKQKSKSKPILCPKCRQKLESFDEASNHTCPKPDAAPDAQEAP